MLAKSLRSGGDEKIVNKKLTSEQLTEIVAEVERLANSREAELSREQVQQICKT